VPDYVPNEFLTFRQHAQRYPNFSEAALRNLRFRSRNRIIRGKFCPANGLAPAFYSRGSRVYIDPQMLRRLIAESQQREVHHG
jgi:hypothetical protein